MSTLVVLGRLVAGRDLDGRERTNARWSTTGTELVDARHAGQWAHQPHRRRASLRIAVGTGASLVAYGAITDWEATTTTLRVAVWLSLAIGCYTVVHKTRKWSHYAEWVKPTAVALADRLGISRHADPASWVRVPLGHREDPDKPAVITLPADYHAPQTQQKALAALAASKLGLTTPDWSIDMAGERPVLTLRAQPGPPELVRFDQVRDLLAAAPEGAPLLGLTAREKPVSASWALDAPSMLVSAGSGSGKSVIGRLVAAQCLHHGGRVVIIDSVKHGASHKWAKGVPNVDLHRQPGSAHDALIALARDVEARCEADWHGDDTTFQRVLVLLEESNATMKQLQSYWSTIRESGDPPRSPALQAVDDISCVGRQARTNLVSVGQMMTTQASGSNVARENAGIRVLARFTKNQARMLIPEILPVPRSSRQPGRTQVAIAGEATETQIIYMTDDEAADWATTGPGQGCVWPGDSASQEVPQLRPVQNGLVSLTDAAERLGVALKTLRNARERDGEFPESAETAKGNVKLYRFEKLQVWARNRERGAAS